MKEKRIEMSEDKNIPTFFYEKTKKRGKVKEKNSLKDVIGEISDSDKESSFYVVLQNGYTIKTLIQYMKEITTHTNMFVRESGIYFEEHSKNNDIVLYFSINTDKIIKYTTYCSSSLVKIGFSISDFYQEISRLPKDSNLILKKNPDSDELIISSNGSHVSKIKINDVLYEQLPFEPTRGPDYRFFLSLKKLQKDLAILKSKKKNLFLCIYEDKIIIENENEKKEIDGHATFEEKDYDDDNFVFNGDSCEQVLKNVAKEDKYSSLADSYPEQMEYYLKNDKFPDGFLNKTERKDRQIFRRNISESVIKIFSKLTVINDQGIAKIHVYEEENLVVFNIGCNEYSDMLLVFRC